MRSRYRDWTERYDSQLARQPSPAATMAYIVNGPLKATGRACDGCGMSDLPVVGPPSQMLCKWCDELRILPPKSNLKAARQARPSFPLWSTPKHAMAATAFIALLAGLMVVVSLIGILTHWH